MSQLRILTWNVAEAAFGDQNTALQAMANFIISKNPDVVLLNEICIWNAWTNGGVNQIAKIAQLAGYPYYQQAQTATLFMKGGKYVAALSRIPLTFVERIQHSAYLDGGGYASLHVCARINNQVHHFFSCRFTAYDATENANSHVAICNAVAALPATDAVFVGGDFNTGYARFDSNNQPTRNEVLPQYANFVSQSRLRHVLGGIGWAFPSPDDQLLMRGAYTFNSTERLSPPSNPSDHPWVFADLSSLDGLQAVPLHDGSVLREQSGATVHVIFGGAKFAVPNPEVLQRLYGGWANVKVITASLAMVPTIPCTGTVLREENSPFVWLIQNVKRRHITTTDLLVQFGGWSAVRIVPDNATANFPTGDPIISVM